MLRKLFLVVVAVFPAFLFAAENGDILSKKASFTTSVQKIADDDFLSLYRRSVEQYVESFIARNELYERTVETADSFEPEVTIPNPSAVICRDKVNTLVSAADYWYTRQVYFAESCLPMIESRDKQVMQKVAKERAALLAEYKKILRHHLLADLVKMTSFAWPVEEDASWENLPKLEYTPFEKGITSYISGAPSEDRCLSLILKMRRTRMESMRDAIVSLVSGEDDDHSLFTRERYGMTLEQLRLFREAERAWEMYYEAASACFIPVWTENCGSGTNGEELKFKMWLIGNHADLLQKTLLFNREDKE